MYIERVMQTVVIQGLGFAGSAMAVAVANALDDDGKPLFNVIGVDLNTTQGQNRVEKIKSGFFPFETVDNKIIAGIKKAVNQGNLSATTDEKVINKADIVIVSINLDLSFKDETPTVDFSPFKKAVHTIGENIREDVLIVVETTVPPGTCETIVKPIILEHTNERDLNPDSVHIAHSYERVMPGTHYLDSIINYWRVYAGITTEAADYCETFYSKVINVMEYPLTRLETTIASETAKVLENSYRAVNIAFIEEWSRFAEEVGIDLYEVINAIRFRPTHSNIRQPGFGVGGYCLTKDPLFAKFAANEMLGLTGHDFPFSSRAVEINRTMPLVTLEKLKAYYNGSIRGKRILLMGVSYKEDIGDTRFSPAELFFIRSKQEGAELDIHDPLVRYWEEMKLPISKEIPNPESFDVIVFTVPHHDYQNIDFSHWLKNKSDKCLVFDANNVLTSIQQKTIKEMNIDLLSIGRA